MIEEPARVLSCDRGEALVQTEQRTACGGCNARAGCGTSLLAQVFGHKPARLRVANPIAAEPGDRVIVGLSERGLLRASMLLYVLPLMGLLLGALGGELLVQRLGLGGGEALSILAGLLGLAAGLGLARNFSRSGRTNELTRAVILRRASEPGPSVALPQRR